MSAAADPRLFPPPRWLPAMEVAARPRSRTGIRVRILLGALLLLVLLAASLVQQTHEMAVTYRGRVAPGIAVDGVPLGGLTAADASARIIASAEARLDRPLRARLDGQVGRTTNRRLGVGSDAVHVAAAMRGVTPSLSFADWFRLRWLGDEVGWSAAVTFDRGTVAGSRS